MGQGKEKKLYVSARNPNSKKSKVGSNVKLRPSSVSWRIRSPDFLFLTTNMKLFINHYSLYIKISTFAVLKKQNSTTK